MKKIKKYYDCSINDISDKMHNINSYGPIENDIMRDLTKYAHLYNFERVYDYKLADVIITNTVYPIDILEWSNKKDIPLIKRMDGIYWQNDLKYKNGLLNRAALESDMVIFISEYSKNSLKQLYGFLPLNNVVILNNIDDKIFYKRKKNNDKFTFVTSATNWNKEHKRLDAIIELSKIINKNDIIKLIGYCDRELPENTIKLGYIDSDEKLSEIIGSSDAFLSLFFRDAGSKVTCQAIQCQLPILHVSSGCLIELINPQNGIVIDDDININFLDNTPKLSIDDLKDGYIDFKRYYKDIKDIYHKNLKYQKTISKYFKIMKDFC